MSFPNNRGPLKCANPKCLDGTLQVNPQGLCPRCEVSVIHLDDRAADLHEIQRDMRRFGIPVPMYSEDEQEVIHMLKAA